MNLDGLNAEGQAALSFAWLVTREPRWTTIDPHRLSFTDPGWDPLGQLDFTIGEGLRHYGILPGNPAAAGFTASTNPDGTVNMQDARRKRNQWVIFLTGANPVHRAVPADSRPSFRGSYPAVAHPLHQMKGTSEMRSLPAAVRPVAIGAVTVFTFGAGGALAVPAITAVTSATPAVAAAAPAAQPGMHYEARFKTFHGAARSGPSDIRVILTTAKCTNMHYEGCT